MSWITGLADKAENILNKIDQNAATALQPPSPGALRKSLSSNTLRGALSPVKVKSDAGSFKSEKGFTVELSNPNSPFNSQRWNVPSEMLPVGLSAISSESPSFSIEMDGNNSGEKVEIAAENVESLSNKSGQSQEENRELAAFKIALKEMTNERDELRLRLSILNNDTENAGLRQRAQELESMIRELVEERDKTQQKLSETLTANNAYVHSISELEATLAKLQQDYSNVTQKLQLQIKETTQKQQELKEYRLKAQRALQSKDAMIAALKTNHANSTDLQANTGMHSLQMELDALKNEYQQSLQENRNLTFELEEIRKEQNLLIKEHTEKLEVMNYNEETLRKELRQERERVISLTSEQRVLAQELHKLRQQLEDHVRISAVQLQEKDELLQRLHAIQKEKQCDDDEAVGAADPRISFLTQALVDKQNAIENVTAERNALRIQVEKLQNELQKVLYRQPVENSPRNALLLNSTDDAKAQYPTLMRETPFDNRVARRVKRAYSSLDSIGIRLGAFLRRYPLIRVFVLVYVGLLHLWVMIVLLSSTPSENM